MKKIRPYIWETKRNILAGAFALIMMLALILWGGGTP